jgi:hypothetical protein
MARYWIGKREATYHLVRASDLQPGDYLYTHSKTWRKAYVVIEVRVDDRTAEIDVRIGIDGRDGNATLPIGRNLRISVLRKMSV